MKVVLLEAQEHGVLRDEVRLEEGRKLAVGVAYVSTEGVRVESMK